MSFPNPDNYARDCDCGPENVAPSLPLKEDKANKGIAFGYAPLDVNAKVPLANLPTIVSTATPDRILGRVTAGVGPIEEIICTSAGRALLDDADATAQRATLSAANASHTHGNITNGGLIGTTANLPIITGSGGILQAGSFGSGANTFCQGNDTRLDRSTFIATWTSGGTPGYRNMANNTLELINFNTTVLNSDSSNYTLELGNANNAIDGKIQIAKTGTYLVNLIYNTFDISPGSFYSFYIYTNGTSKSTASSHSVTLFDQEPAGGSASTGARYLFGGMTGVVNVSSAPLWISLVFRPTVGNPYPTDGTSGSTTQPPRVEITKLT